MDEEPETKRVKLDAKDESGPSQIQGNEVLVTTIKTTTTTTTTTTVETTDVTKTVEKVEAATARTVRIMSAVEKEYRLDEARRLGSI